MRPTFRESVPAKILKAVPAARAMASAGRCGRGVRLGLKRSKKFRRTGKRYFSLKRGVKRALHHAISRYTFHRITMQD